MVGNRIYQFSRKGEREVMMAIDADSGKVLWQTGYAAAFTDERGGGARSRTEVDAGVLERTALFHRHDRHRHGLRRGVGQADVAEAGVARGPDVHDARVLPDHQRPDVIFHLGGHDEGAITAFDVNTGDVRMDLER